MPMRNLWLIAIPLLLLTACDPKQNVSDYENDPQKRVVKVDDHKIYVVPTGYHAYVAWGGSSDRDGRVQYRQRRAVELVSGCRIAKISTKKTDDVLHTTVKCEAT